MRITKLNSFIILSLVVFSLSACGNEKKEGAPTTDESTTTDTSEKKDILASLGLENQNDVNTRDESLSISVLESSYMGAPTYEGKVLEADNVFVATVENMETVYPDPLYDEKGELIASTPKTIFELKVLENLRGELPINETIKASRDFFGFGDGPEKGKFITLIEDDIIPENGKTYVFLTFVLDGELAILPGGETPSNLPLENAPMDLDTQSEEVIQEIVDSSSKIHEVEEQIENEEAVLAEIGDTLLSKPEIESRIAGQGNEPDLDKVVVE
ncbi:hypothetical protein [Enterococcus sp. LJL51]|uniref:hypothetical protein n=1 Tax=Enterococcus sp. LJL51 TaxID=3416656 RepID=UPI003CF43D02